MRKPIIAGNWKMNKGVKEAKELVEAIKAKELDKDVEAVVCTPFVDLPVVSEILKDTEIGLGAQNMYFEESGAYTGEVSPTMLKEIGVEYVILGHSERREYFKETDELVNKKVKAALKHGLKPIICVGETLEEREAGKEKEKVEGQVKEDLKDIPAERFEEIVIAYEPIWAIGTGKTASSDDAEEMCKYIRELISQISEDAAEKIRIQYGGSVKPHTITELMEKENVDGALVGGASLEADSFEALVNY